MTYKYSNKIDSLTAILRKLNNMERVTTGSLALEMNVTERSIYRYLENLQAAGYPIYFDHDTKSYRFSENFKLTKSPVDNDLAQALDLSRHVVSSATVAIAVYRSNGECVMSNEAMGRLMGTPDRSVYGRNFRLFADWRESGLLSMAQEVLQSGEERSGDFKMVAAVGREIWFHCTMMSIVHGGECYLVVTAQNLSPRMKKELQVAKFFAAINQSVNLIMITDLQGTIRYVSEKIYELTGYTADEVVGQNPRMFKTEETKPTVHARLWSTISKGYEWNGELCNRRKDGSSYWEHMRVSPIFDADSVLTHYVAVKQDVTHQKELDEELYHYAILDHLTGAYNRRMLVKMGSRELSLAQRYERHMTLLLLDVDCLSRINHLYGHPAGDDVLRQVVLICHSGMRETDILARVEADCFALLLPDADQQGAYQVAERIRRQVASHSFRRPDATFSCTVSISGTLLSSHYVDLEQMLQVGHRLLHQQPVVFNRIVGIHG
ncbi:MAG: PAS domain S-box protein [Desulfuromonadaceae bacterium]|nr:PAS domain S-box protein [Desulfuromonadaceae bacterium]